MAKGIAKSRRPQAERAAEHWLREILGCVCTRRAVRTKWAAVDFFGADIVGKTETGAHCYVQVTAGKSQAVTARRRKLEAIPWHDWDTVILLQLIETKNPAHGRRKQWWFRVYEYETIDDPPSRPLARQWRLWESATAVPPRWFKAWKEG